MLPDHLDDPGQSTLKSLTIIYTTARQEPKIEWFLDSLASQLGKEQVSVIVVWYDQPKEIYAPDNISLRYTAPKPSVWQGAARLTKQDWWAKSNALNTGIALARTDWIACVDDRCVLLPGWLNSIREAMVGRYAVCGSYEKRHGLKVEAGQITDPGTMDGTDVRSPKGRDHRELLRNHVVKCVGGWWFGCCNALPLGWALAVNGYSEDLCDGLGMEDVCFGLTLEHSGFEIRYDPRMKAIQDRTPGELGKPMIRRDFGTSPDDKSHALLKKFQNAKTSGNSFDIRKLRESVLRGEPWPKPSAIDRDWYTGTPLAEMQ